MSDLDRFDARWKRLVAAARQAPTAEPRQSRPGWVERVAREALRTRTSGSPRPPERLAWAGLVGLAAIGVAGVLVWPGPVASTADALTLAAVALPRAVPHAPRLPRAPAAPRPPLPSRDSALAAVFRVPQLDLDLPIPPRRTDTP